MLRRGLDFWRGGDGRPMEGWQKERTDQEAQRSRQADENDQTAGALLAVVEDYVGHLTWSTPAEDESQAPVCLRALAAKVLAAHCPTTQNRYTK